jgi:hypothetical protein
VIKQVIKPVYRLHCDICGFSIPEINSLPVNWSKVTIRFNGSQREFDCCDSCTKVGIKIPTLQSLNEDMGIF